MRAQRRRVAVGDAPLPQQKVSAMLIFSALALTAVGDHPRPHVSTRDAGSGQDVEEVGAAVVIPEGAAEQTQALAHHRQLLEAREGAAQVVAGAAKTGFVVRTRRRPSSSPELLASSEPSGGDGPLGPVEDGTVENVLALQTEEEVMGEEEGEEPVAAQPIQPQTATDTVAQAVPAPADPILASASALRSSAVLAGKRGDWAECRSLYEEACRALRPLVDGADGESDGAAGEAAGEATARREAATREQQECTLNLAVSCIRMRQWEDAITACSGVIRTDPQCGLAWYRRGVALQGRGQHSAAAWDLKKAVQLMPSSKRVAAALSRAERDSERDGAEGAAAGGGSALAAQLQGLQGGDASGGLGSLSSLFEGLGGPASGASGGGAPTGDMLEMFSSMAGSLGGLGGTKSGGDEDPLEKLLSSPLVAALGGGEGTKRALGLLGVGLKYRRRAKQVWRALKPYMPLLFWLVLLLPYASSLLGRILGGGAA